MPLSSILPLLPTPLQKELSLLLSSPFLSSTKPAEVRLRQGRISSLSVFRGGRLVNLPLSFSATEADIRKTLSLAVGGSTYAFEEALKEGFVPIGGGVRLGVCGRAVAKDGSVLALRAPENLVFRLPTGRASADALFSFFEGSDGGILVFAPPGGGKTTLLRAFAERAAKCLRVAVVDSREEFFFSSRDLLLDLLSGYPKARGAEIALRTLSPEVLVLDEIGAAEASALSSLVSFGVRTVASIHGEKAEELLRAPALRPLFLCGLFSHLWDVRRSRATPIEGRCPL